MKIRFSHILGFFLSFLEDITEIVTSVSSLVMDVVVRQGAVTKSLMGVKGSRSLKVIISLIIRVCVCL